MTDITCPYCDYEQEVCQDDGQHCEQDSYEEMQCDDCEKYFMVTTSIMWLHKPHKADCLNENDPTDETHAWIYTRTINRERPYYRKCCACDLEETITKEHYDQYYKIQEDKYEKELEELIHD